jgi:hypothetical protein
MGLECHFREEEEELNEWIIMYHITTQLVKRNIVARFP